MKLLDYLHRGGTVAHYWTPNTGEFYTNAKGEQVESKHSLWFPAGNRPPVPAGWLERNVYFCVHPCASAPDKTKTGKTIDPKYTKARLSHVSVVNCFFGEFDVKDYGDKAGILAHLKTLPLYPSVIVDSGGGFHCYWLLDTPCRIDDENRTTVKAIQYAWVDLVKSDNDAKDLARVLRVPGTKNLKYGPDFPTVTAVHEDYSAVYRLEQFDELTKELRQKEESQKTYTGETSFTDDVATAARCLKALAIHRRDEYSAWIEVGMALTPLGQTGLQLWEEWSQGSSKYNPDECASKWKTFDNNSAGLGIGSLVKWAKEDDPGYGLRFHANGNSSNHQHQEDETPEDEAPPEPEPQPGPAIDIQQYYLYQSADDEGNAQCVNRAHGAHFLYCDAYGWMHNIGTHWVYGGMAEKEVNLAVTQTLINRRVAAVQADREAIIKATKPSATNKENTKRQFKDIVWCDVGIFDQEKHLLNCRNGIVDLRTGKLITSEASGYFTYCVNAEFHPGMDAQEWENFLLGTIKDYDSIRGWLQMACGYSITGFTSEEIMFYCFGPARSGKGTFTNSFLHMLGHPLALGVNFSTFTSKREGDSQNFDLAPLKPSRFIAASESGKHQSLNEAVIKQITGNDPIRASFKGKDHFTYFPQFKIWVSSNHPIKGDVDDDAFWGRLNGIEFPNSHLGEEDKSLKERIQAPEYCNMVLSWSVAGARLWHEQPNGLVTPASVKETVSGQRAQLDNVQRWLDECTQQRTGIDTANDALRKSYEDWCKQNGESPKFAVQFGKAMSAKGYESTNVKVHGISKRGYKDIVLLAPEPDDRPESGYWSG